MNRTNRKDGTNGKGLFVAGVGGVDGIVGVRGIVRVAQLAKVGDPDLRDECDVAVLEKEVHFGDHDGRRVDVRSEELFRIGGRGGEEKTAAPATGIEQRFALLERQPVEHPVDDDLGRVVGARAVFVSFGKEALVDEPQEVDLIGRQGDGRQMRFDGDSLVLPKHLGDVGLRLKARSRQEAEAQREKHLRDPEMPSVRVVDDRSYAGEVFGVGQVLRRLDALRGTLLVRAGDEPRFGARVRLKPCPVSGGGCGDRCAGGGNRAVGIGWGHRRTSGKRRPSASPARKERDGRSKGSTGRADARELCLTPYIRRYEPKA